MRQTAKMLGLPYTTYVNYEKGDREPNSEMLIILADFFDVSVDYLICKDPTYREDEELEELLETLKNRPECRMLFKLAANATAEDVRQAVRIIEAIRKKD